MSDQRNRDRSGPLRIAVAGCGRFSEPGHLFYYYLHPGAELVAVCDVNEKAAKKMANRYRAPGVYTDFETMLDTVNPDAVSVCTPTFTHPDLVCAAAARGIHVLCEKPMSPSVAEGERMIAACRAAGVVFHVGFHKRCDRGLIRLKEILDSKEYGECFQAETEWLGLSTFGNIPYINTLLGLANDAGVSTEKFSPGWRLNDSRCPGGVFEVICHLIDLSIWMFGPPDSVEGETRRLTQGVTRPDHAVILLKRSAAATSYLTMSRKALSFREEDKGVFRCTAGNVYFNTNSSRQTIFPARVSAQSAGGLFGVKKSLDVFPEISLLTSPHYRKIDNFLKDIKGELPVSEEQIVCRGDDALETDKVVARFADVECA